MARTQTTNHSTPILDHALDTEQRLGRVLPYDLRAYFAVTGGMEPNEMDSLYF